jgi:peptidoglycan/LPS O-acetylase OafA/YrhL
MALVANAPRSAAPPKARTLRLTPFDSLRGLAALTVVFCHVLWLCKSDTALRVMYRSTVTSAWTWHGLTASLQALPPTFYIESTPLHLFTAGHEAVILFYLISGFVLYHSYPEGSLKAYRAFIMRRLCRLYLPFVVALAVAVGLNATLSNGHVASMNAWFNQTWQVPVDWSQAARHLTLVGNFNTDLFMMQSWTLVHEMRVSLAFPLIALLVMRWPRRTPLAILLLSATGMLLDRAYGIYNTYGLTLHYAAFFALGALMARYRSQCASFYPSLRSWQRLAFLTVAVLFYVYGRAVTIGPRPAQAADLPTAFGAALIMVVAMGNPRLLRTRAITWLGKVSYGLYLLHLSLFFGLIHLLHDRVPLWAIMLLGLVVSLVAAEVFWRLVEAPAIRLGRRVSAWISRPEVEFPPLTPPAPILRPSA